MYGSKSSNIAAFKATRLETLPTNKTYQLNKRDIDASKAGKPGCPAHDIVHTTLVFKIEFLS